MSLANQPAMIKDCSDSLGKRHILSPPSAMIVTVAPLPRFGTIIMFWTFLLFAVLALVFVKLGAYSVWVGILSIGIKAALVIICLLTTALAWRWVPKRIAFFRKHRATAKS
jgi:hypothetical protein